jgi:protein gp37
VTQATPIEWATHSWNPTRGCRRVSAGCEHCYAESLAHRFSGPGLAYEGLTTERGRWTGEVRFLPEKLGEPLSWRKPRERVFVNSMSDLFHEDVTDEQIAAVFGVMAAVPASTFLVLTKRPKRALEFFAWLEAEARKRDAHDHGEARMFVLLDAARKHTTHRGLDGPMPSVWPLPSVWLGVSVEDQATADERIPLLLQCPAAVRWVSYEPALGPVRFDKHVTSPPDADPPADGCWEDWLTGRKGRVWGASGFPSLDWVVVGGESGPRARPFDVAWARSTIAQCRRAGVPVFVKQIGAWSGVRNRAGGFDSWRHGHGDVYIRHPKGGMTDEWPADLRVRELP